MKDGQKLWSRDELILAINLYCKLPFGKIHLRNTEVIRLAEILGRTPGSVSFKLVNFASLDPSLQARGISGARNASKLDKEIWDEFYNNWGTLPYQSELLLAERQQIPVTELNDINEIDLPKVGKMREQMVKVRVNQSFFRKAVLASYNDTCCITGLQQRELLVAGHIMPWSTDEKNRMNPQNGIAINALHDKAFELGLMTITPEMVIKISPEVLRQNKPGTEEYFTRYDNQPIHLPSRFLPDVAFLKYHNEVRFMG